MLKKLLVHYIGSNMTLDRGIRAIDERIGQRRPRIIGHADDHHTGRCRRDRGASRSATVFTRVSLSTRSGPGVAGPVWGSPVGPVGPR